MRKEKPYKFPLETRERRRFEPQQWQQIKHLYR